MNEQATIVALIQLAATGWDDWDAGLRELLRIDAHVLGVERVGFWSYRTAPPSLFCELAFASKLEVFERGESLAESENATVFSTFRDQKLLDASDARRDPRSSQLGRYLEAHGITSVLDVPIVRGGELVGVLCHEHVGAPRVWDASERQFALAITQSVRVALEARARTRAERSERAAVFLTGSSWALSQSRDPEEVANRAVRAALPILGDDALLIAFLDERSTHVVVASQSAERKKVYEAQTRGRPPQRRRNDLVGRLAQRPRSVLIPMIGEAQVQAQEILEPDQVEMIRSLGALSVMITTLEPTLGLGTNGGALGELIFVSVERSFDQADLHIAEEYARLVGGALENAALFTNLRDAMCAREEFVTLASHELSTPLAALRLAAEALDKKLVDNPAAVQHAVHAILRQTDRLERLVGRLITDSEIDIGRLSIDRRPLDLADVARKAAAKLAEASKQKGCRLDIDAKAPVSVQGDARQLGLLIGELLDNAMTFGRGKPVALTVHSRNGHAVISVRDGGPGVDPERRREIFDRFHRGSLSTRSFGGLGLGLHLARSIAEAHGGTIRVESRPDDGAQFIVELPALEAGTGDHDG